MRAELNNTQDNFPFDVLTDAIVKAELQRASGSIVERTSRLVDYTWKQSLVFNSQLSERNMPIPLMYSSGVRCPRFFRSKQRYRLSSMKSSIRLNLPQQHKVAHWHNNLEVIATRSVLSQVTVAWTWQEPESVAVV